MAARAELKKREASRTSLLGFTTYTKPDYQIGPHHPRICDGLEAVERGDCLRLMIFAPPRGGKSELASRRFPAWFLGRKEGRSVIAASYGQKLANAMGRDVRSIVDDTSYSTIFPDLKLSADTSAKHEWQTNRGGSYLGAGVGAGIAGRGADLFLVDDPLAGRKEADSETKRNDLWDWYQGVAVARLSPNAAIVVIQTRWHPDDLAGRLLDIQAAGGRRWEVIEFPAVTAENESYWPERWTRAALRNVESESGSREWNAQYMQRPSSSQGMIFKVALIEVIDADPASGSVVRAWDLAATRKAGTRDPDWTVGTLMRRTAEGRFVIVDQVRFRGGPEEVRQAIVNTATQDGKAVPVDLPQDPGQAGKAQVADLTRALAGYRVSSSTESGDKATRAAPLASQVNVGNVSLVRGPWNRPLLDEFAAFPAGTHDDQVDAASRAFTKLAVPQQTARSIPFNLFS